MNLNSREGSRNLGKQGPATEASSGTASSWSPWRMPRLAASCQLRHAPEQRPAWAITPEKRRFRGLIMGIIGPNNPSWDTFQKGLCFGGVIMLVSKLVVMGPFFQSITCTHNTHTNKYRERERERETRDTAAHARARTRTRARTHAHTHVRMHTHRSKQQA